MFVTGNICGEIMFAFINNFIHEVFPFCCDCRFLYKLYIKISEMYILFKFFQKFMNNDDNRR